MTTAPKKGCFGRNLFITCGVLVVICIVLGVVAYVVVGPSITKVFNTVTAPITAANDFMTAVVAKDYTKAQTQLSTGQKATITTADALKQAIIDQGGEPSSYTQTGFQFGDTVALVTGTVIVDGTTKYSTIGLTKEGDTWKIDLYTTTTTPPTALPATATP